jgi:hypothetical protein
MSPKNIPPPITPAIFTINGLGLTFLIQVNEHQRVQEQYQDSPHVNYKVYDGQKLGV